MNLMEPVHGDFTRARRRAFRRMRARLRKDLARNRLLSFDEANVSLGACNKVYLGMRVVQVEKIVGSANLLVNAAGTGPGGRMIEELAAARGATSEDARDFLVDSSLLRRPARPEDGSAATLFYASDLSAFITGTSPITDGGAHYAIL